MSCCTLSQAAEGIGYAAVLPTLADARFLSWEFWIAFYQDLQLIDYGFVYHRDPNWPQDDLHWFLMEKR